MKKSLVYATTNPGKLAEVAKLLSAHNIVVQSPADYDIHLEVDENGQTLEENAILKAESCRDALPKDIIVLGDDTGVEIDVLGGEPGIHVRRWKGYKMTDDEIIAYTLERLQGVRAGKRTAQFRTVIAAAKKGLMTKTFAGTLDGSIVVEPTSIRIDGFPFAPLFYATKYKLMLGDLHDMSIEEKLKQNIATHRERAIIASLPYLATLFH